MGPGGLRQGKVRSQEVTTSTLDTPSTSRPISPEKSAQIFTQLAPFCMRAFDIQQPRCGSHQVQMLRSYERRRLFDSLEDPPINAGWVPRACSELLDHEL